MDDSGSGVTPSERKMRSALEARRGAAFSEEEWDEAKRNLVGLFLMIGLQDASPEDESPPE